MIVGNISVRTKIELSNYLESKSIFSKTHPLNIKMSSRAKVKLEDITKAIIYIHAAMDDYTLMYDRNLFMYKIDECYNFVFHKPIPYFSALSSFLKRERYIAGNKWDGYCWTYLNKGFVREYSSEEYDAIARKFMNYIIIKNNKHINKQWI